MRVIDWLLTQDPVIVRLTKKYLLDHKVAYTHKGYIEKYLTLYDHKTNMWGGGFYSPKWVSTHYTLLELREMEIDPHHFIYHTAVNHLVSNIWVSSTGRVNKYRHQDLCVVGMMINLLGYSDVNHPAIPEMVNYIISHQMMDGGWNCLWEMKRPKQSSLHTTLSVLEGFQTLIENSYSNQNLVPYINQGISFILKKRLFKRETNNQIIHPDMASHHYPARWKYDYLRALLFMERIHYPHHSCFDEGLNMLENEIKKGYLTPGYKYPGKTHFRLELKKSGFNTLRALRVLRCYRNTFYKSFIIKDFDV